MVSQNSGFRREILTGIRYANDSLGEDMLFSSDLAKQGRQLLFLPRASVTHLNRKGLRTVFGYQRKVGHGTFLYRSKTSPKTMSLLHSAPSLTFLMPFSVMFWIGVTILRYRRATDFLRFVGILPLCFLANMVWACGFHEALQQVVLTAAPDDKHAVLDSSPTL